jgi:hypothetical protein
MGRAPRAHAAISAGNTTRGLRYAAAARNADPDAQLVGASGNYSVTRGPQSATVTWLLVGPDRIALTAGPAGVLYQLSQSAFLDVQIDLNGPVGTRSGAGGPCHAIGALAAVGLTSPAVKAVLRQLFGSDRLLRFSGIGDLSPI